MYKLLIRLLAKMTKTQRWQFVICAKQTKELERVVSLRTAAHVARRTFFFLKAEVNRVPIPFSVHKKDYESFGINDRVIVTIIKHPFGSSIRVSRAH